MSLRPLQLARPSFSAALGVLYHQHVEDTIHLALRKRGSGQRDYTLQSLLQRIHITTVYGNIGD